MLLVILAGAVLLLLPPLWEKDETKESTAESQAGQAGETADSVSDLERRLEEALSQIQGAGEAQVVLTLKSGSRQVLAQDTQRGADGDSSSATVTLGRGSGSQEVVPLQTLAPQFQGALVVCPGGDNPEVCLQIIQAVSALTGLGSDRISVCPSQ